MNFVIGLTGGIGAGKTEVLREFSRLGARTISLDRIAREQARPGGSAYQGILRAFGRDILDASGKINRPRLARLVFSNLKMRRKLERLTHPLILKEMKNKMRAAAGVVVVDVPLLFEGGLDRNVALVGGRARSRSASEGSHEKYFDATMAVSASEKIRVRRAAQRDGRPSLEIQRRASAQMPESERVRRADVVLYNEGSRSHLREEIRGYWNAFRLIQKNKRQESPAWKP